MTRVHSLDGSAIGSIKVPHVEPEYTLERIGHHAVATRDNMHDINSGLRNLLSHLRGEALAGEGAATALTPLGKLAEISIVQQDACEAQDETFRLITELRTLLNANA